MFTRTDYLRQSQEPGAFARYYGEIIAECGGPSAFRAHLPVPLEDIRAALAAGDTHLNTIRLALWDERSMSISQKCGQALRARGDYPTLGNSVCILKEAARLLAGQDRDGAR